MHGSLVAAKSKIQEVVTLAVTMAELHAVMYCFH
jgi:hypothetical protein